MPHVAELTTDTEWKTVLEESLQQPVFVFKHSTTCPISARAWQEYQAYLEDTPNPGVIYTSVKVIEAKDVSNQITNDLDINHQSPQAILIKNKEAVWDTAHGNITKAQLDKTINNS